MTPLISVRPPPSPSRPATDHRPPAALGRARRWLRFAVELACAPAAVGVFLLVLAAMVFAAFVPNRELRLGLLLGLLVASLAWAVAVAVSGG